MHLHIRLKFWNPSAAFEQTKKQTNCGTKAPKAHNENATEIRQIALETISIVVKLVRFKWHDIRTCGGHTECRSTRCSLRRLGGAHCTVNECIRMNAISRDRQIAPMRIRQHPAAAYAASRLDYGDDDYLASFWCLLRCLRKTLDNSKMQRETFSFKLHQIM